MAGTSGEQYGAFISYNQRVDGKLAPAIQAGLHRFAKPWYRMRALRVFRDDASLSANPDLWGSIQSALGASDWFVVLASPEAARSEWVAREIGHWRTHKPLDHVLLVVTDGEVAWDSRSGDFDWSRTTAVPPSLSGAFVSEPRFIDLRWARTEEDVSLRNARFRDAVADIAAAVHGRPKDELLGEDVRQHRRTLRLARGGVSLLVLLLVVALVAAFVAFRERARAERQALIATSRQLAAEAVNVSETRYDLSLLLATQAQELRPGRATSDALLTVLADNVHFAGFIGSSEPVSAVATTATGALLVTGDHDGRVTVYDGASLEILTSHRAHGARVAALAFSPDADRLVSMAEDGSAALWMTRGGSPEPRVLRSAATSSEPVVAVAGFSADGDRLAIAFSDGVVVEYDTDGRELATESVEGVLIPKAVIYRGDRLEVGGSQGRVVTVRGGASDAPGDAESSPSGGATSGSTRNVGAGQPLVSAYAPDGSLFAGITITLDTPYVNDAETGAGVGGPLQGPAVRVDAMTFAAQAASPSDVLPLLATAGENEVVIWDMEAASVRGTLSGFPGVPTSLAMDSAGQRVMVASEVGTTVWDLGRHSLVEEVDPPNSVSLADVPNVIRGAVDVAFSPDGRHVAWIVTTPDAREVVVLDVDSRREVQRVSTPFVGVEVSFDAAGGVVTVFGPDDEFAFDVATGDERAPSRPTADDQGVGEADSTTGDAGVMHSATRRRATVSAAGVLTIFDLDRDVPVAEIEVPGAFDFSAVAFSPEGDHLAVATPGGTLDLVELGTDEWIDIACTLAGRTLTEEERDRFLGDLDPRDPCA